MPIKRLTQRAKAVILSSYTGNRTDVQSIIGSIRESGGVGTFILHSTPDIRFDGEVRVDLANLVEEAYSLSASLGHVYVGTEHLLAALLKISSSPDSEVVKTQIQRINIYPRGEKFLEQATDTPLLDSFGKNLNEAVLKYNIPPPVGREELESVISILLQKNNPSPLLIGNTGVGKGRIVDLLVHRINSLEVPPQLAEHKIIEFDALSFIANISGREGLEYSLATLIEEMDKVGKVILSIKNLQNMFISTNLGVTAPLVFTLLETYLSTAGIKLIATIDRGIYEKVSSENDQLLRGFTVVEIKEPDDDKVLEIMEANSRELEYFHGVRIRTEVVEYALDKADSDLDGKFPLKGVELLDQACTKLLIKSRKVPDRYKNLITKRALMLRSIREGIENSDFGLAEKSRVKVRRLERRIESERVKMFSGKNLVLTTEEVDEALDEFGYASEGESSLDLVSLSSLQTTIKERIIGQDDAVELVSKALIRSRLGLRPRKRPLGNFLFLGPTGVGKTELAKVLADSAFGQGSLIRLDMSDFGEKHTVSRLVGAPPGYVGYGEGGELTTKIENTPDSVVLFDEIEKAHPDVMNILLQVMEEGELSDARGNTFDFSRAVIVLTSNLGTDILHKRDIGFEEAKKTDDRVERRLKDNLRKILKPELLNRFDETIVFKKLKPDAQKEIVELLLGEVEAALKKQDVKLKVYSKAKYALLKEGYSEEYGARALRRTIERDLLDKVAEILLRNKDRPLKLKAKARKDTIYIETADNNSKNHRKS